MASRAAKVCVHCGHPRVNRPRGLCWRCYYTPGIKRRYGSSHRGAHRGVPDGNGRRPVPAEPTAALPGTPEKVEEMARRARRGERLFHPRDRMGDLA